MAIFSRDNDRGSSLMLSHPALTPVPIVSVSIDDKLLSPRIETNRKVTLATEYRLCRDTGRLNAFEWEEGMPNPPHVYWDSDVAKWIEAAAYVLEKHKDSELEKQLDDYIDTLVSAQDETGYANSHFLRVEPDAKWKNLRDDHELYCAGHLMEAAVAYYRATGKRVLLDAMCRFADHIEHEFGVGLDQRRGYPGHEEVELALVRLYEATGEERYLQLASYFVDERGQQPFYFEQECDRKPGEHKYSGGRAYYQGHLPVREQTTAEGHAVRACYLYCGMADVARNTYDEPLMDACRAIWQNLVQCRMYITGGIGSSHDAERFTYDYDLPNESAYAETCAAISLFFFAHRMLRTELKGEYGDVMERTFYNGILSGISIDGLKFFYVNPLTQYPRESEEKNWTVGRQEWFECACCPPNIARLLASLGEYIYLTGSTNLVVNMYIGSKANISVAETPVAIEIRSDYPFDGGVELLLSPEKPTQFTLSLRIPGWCHSFVLSVNGETVKPKVLDGFALIKRVWVVGDLVKLSLDMPVERIYSHPAVRQNCGRVALQRGPVVYCLEEIDNGSGLCYISIPKTADVELVDGSGMLEGLPCLSVLGRRNQIPDSSSDEELYSSIPPVHKEAGLIAVPYFAWANRGDGEMQVWTRETLG